MERAVENHISWRFTFRFNLSDSWLVVQQRQISAHFSLSVAYSLLYPDPTHNVFTLPGLTQHSDILQGFILSFLFFFLAREVNLPSQQGNKNHQEGGIEYLTWEVNFPIPHIMGTKDHQKGVNNSPCYDINTMTRLTSIINLTLIGTKINMYLFTLIWRELFGELLRMASVGDLHPGLTWRTSLVLVGQRQMFAHVWLIRRTFPVIPRLLPTVALALVSDWLWAQRYLDRTLRLLTLRYSNVPPGQFFGFISSPIHNLTRQRRKLWLRTTIHNGTDPEKSDILIF